MLPICYVTISVSLRQTWEKIYRRLNPVKPSQPTRVFESVSTDYFHVGGRTYLIYVDRLSGWPYVTVCPRTASAEHLTRELRMLFSQTGVPSVLRSDGGPQFASATLRRFLQRWDVTHEMSSPHHARSNGHAEACVKTVKKLVLAASRSGRLDDDQLDRGLLELRNTPRVDGRSPAQIVFGHPLRSGVPTHHRAFLNGSEPLLSATRRLPKLRRRRGSTTIRLPTRCPR